MTLLNSKNAKEAKDDPSACIVNEYVFGICKEY
jgi:hypothetical protein